ncbi:MAG: methyltransferase, partial [Oscillospiraceae bacterium]|nr:methyltransferase [Oscillospiraceae bacterium]
FPVGSGKSAKSENTAIARDERMCTLSDVCRAAAYFTRWGGKFAIVHRPERLSELFCEMTKNGIEPKRLRLVQETEGSPPNLVLVEGRRGGNPGLSIEQPLVIRDADGCQTDFVNRIYRWQTGKERQ